MTAAGWWPTSQGHCRYAIQMPPAARNNYAGWGTLIILNGEEQPQSVECDEPFTVRHILLECVDVSNVKSKYYHVNTIIQLYNDVTIDNIFYS